MFICAAWKKIVEGPLDSRRTLVYRCDLEEGHKGKHCDHVLLMSWDDKDSDPSCKPRNEFNQLWPVSRSTDSQGDGYKEGRQINGQIRIFTQQPMVDRVAQLLSGWTLTTEEAAKIHDIVQMATVPQKEARHVDNSKV